MSFENYFKSHITSIENTFKNIDFKLVDQLIDHILNCNGKVFMTGVGKNGHVAAKAASTFSSIGVPVFFLNPVDSVHGDMGVITDDDIIIAISKSGNTEELVTFLHHVHEKNCKIISVHSSKDNQSLSYSTYDIFLPIDKEADHLNIVPTTSIAVYTIFLQSIACEISRRKNLTIEQFVSNHPGGSIGKTKI